MTTMTVLFMCPHAAGKSLLAATYFRAAAERLGVEASIAVAGPDPDAENMPTVTASLQRQGYTIGWSPKLVERADTDQADLLVSVGCNPSDIPTDRTMVEWNVPLLSEDFDRSVRAIHAHAESLASDLAAAAK